MKGYVALGSNQGDRLAILQAAAEALRDLSRTPLQKSPLYETTPVDCPPNSPSFLNAVVELLVDDSVLPAELLSNLQAIEARLGRKPKQILNEPRPIDLDLICCGDHRHNTRALTLPHPRAHLRRFVLQPLCDLSPALILPGQTRTVRELLAALPVDESIRRYAKDW